MLFALSTVLMVAFACSEKVATLEERAQAYWQAREKELNAVGPNGYEFCNITVAKTAFGGNEVVAILRKQIN